MREDRGHRQTALPQGSLLRRVRGNCSAKPWARPPAGLSSMATERPTECPPSTSIGTGAGSEDATRGVGAIRSVRLPCSGMSRLASTFGWPVTGWTCRRSCAVAARGRAQAEKSRPRRKLSIGGAKDRFRQGGVPVLEHTRVAVAVSADSIDVEQHGETVCQCPLLP